MYWYRENRQRNTKIKMYESKKYTLSALRCFYHGDMPRHTFTHVLTIFIQTFFIFGSGLVSRRLFIFVVVVVCCTALYAAVFMLKILQIQSYRNVQWVKTIQNDIQNKLLHSSVQLSTLIHTLLYIISESWLWLFVHNVKKIIIIKYFNKKKGKPK
jgi:MFS superfamily sulfate permease-like transporter